MSTSKTQERLFGTDGLRGRFGEGWLTAERVSALGRAVGEEFGRDGAGGRALVGHDGRRSGPILEAALARGLKECGIETTSAGLITTPGVALLGRLRDFDVTAMISASHNPAEDNGIKIFGPGGDKLGDDVEDRIEERLRANYAPAAESEAPAVDTELELAYLEYLIEAMDGLQLDGMTIALDCANGGGSRIAPRVLGRIGAQVVPIACSPDGDNINQECGSTQPSVLQEAVRRHSADLGIALDGDGDRCILADAEGAIVHGDGILTLLGRHLKETGRLQDPRIVATVMSNRGLHRALREVGVDVVTVGVGDRRVVEALRREKLSLGGEQSGHIVFGADHFHIGDGMYTALRVLQTMRESGLGLTELASAYVPFPQVLVNVPVAQKPNLSGVASVVELVEAIERNLGDDGRVLLRYSGTEPLARVMVEGPDEAWIRAQAEALAERITHEIGA